MNVNARTGVEPPPAPGEVVFRIRLDDTDGELARHFAPGGPVEVWLMASERPKNADGRDGLRYIMLPLAFPNYPVARFRANGITQALGQLERAIERALADADHAIPTRDDGHPHVVRFARFSRTMPLVAICEVCMEELVPDVKKWAHDRRLLHEGAHPIVTEAQKPTIRTAIENAVNRVGEEADLG